MPDRILRQSVRTSPTVDSLSFEAESMFYRLMTVADDFGRFEADPRLLLSNCFPLKVDRLKVAQVANWFDELLISGLAKRYELHGRTYGFLVNWAKYQRPRAKDSKFPEPPTDDFDFIPPPDECLPLIEDSNCYEQNMESDNLCCQPQTIVPDIRYSIFEETISEEEDLSSQTSADAEISDERDPPVANNPVTVDALIDRWNWVCGGCGLPTKSARGRKNPAFRKKIKLRLQENPDHEFWESVLKSIPESPFLRGDKGWKATLDWLVESPNNPVKVFDGNYAQARASPPGMTTTQQTDEAQQNSSDTCIGYPTRQGEKQFCHYHGFTHFPGGH
jgi:hypothetical protein